MGKQWKQCQTLFLGSKTTADGLCSNKIKRCLLLGRKVMTNLDHTLKSRDITLPTKVHLVKAMVFPGVMYGCEIWTKESWAPKNWCFWTVLLAKTLENPLDCKEIQPVPPKGNESLVLMEELMLKLKLQYFGHLMWRADSLEKTLMLGKIEGRRRRDQQTVRFSMASLTQLTWVWVNSGNWWWTGRPNVLWFMGLQKVGHNWATDLNWKPKHHSAGDAVSTHWLVRFPGLGNATHSSNPVWRIPWTEEPGGL